MLLKPPLWAAAVDKRMEFEIKCWFLLVKHYNRSYFRVYTHILNIEIVEFNSINIETSHFCNLYDF